MSLTQPVSPPERSTQGIGNGDLVTTTDSSALSSPTSLPSMESSTGERVRGEMDSRTVPFAGRITVRNESDRGATGVRRTASTSGWEMGPPAESEYAVEPVGVDRRRPSAWVSGCILRTHHCFCQVLAVKVCVHDGEMRMPPAMQRHLVHYLEPVLPDVSVGKAL